MSSYLSSVVNPTSSIEDTIKVINNGAAQVALVVESDFRLIGIVTDGDIRRALLSEIKMNEPISSIMTKSPICLTKDSSRSDALKLMKEKFIHHIPVVKDKMILIDLFVLDDLIQKPSFGNHVVLMAGGKGERLKPLTNDCPKPMLAVNGKPILEIILERCIEAGFKKFYISVNYLKDQIIDFFENGNKWGVNINYLNEEHPLGTCGCLSLLPNDITEDIIVMNGDIITDLDLDRLIRFHEKSKSKMTICCRSHRIKIPFAVLKSEENFLKSFVEKPIYDYQVNAGVYVLNPKCLESVPASFYNMTDLMKQLISENQKIGVFPIHESWKDIGNPTEFEEVVGEWK